MKDRQGFLKGKRSTRYENGEVHERVRERNRTLRKRVGVGGPFRDKQEISVESTRNTPEEGRSLRLNL